MSAMASGVDLVSTPSPAKPYASTPNVASRAEWQRVLLHLSSNRAAVLALGLLVIVGGAAAAAPLLTPYSPIAQDLSARLEGPSWQHWFGTDRAGRDELSRILFGGRVTLTVGLISVVIGSIAGIALGLTAGYCGTWIDAIIMRSMEVVLAFPGVLLAIIIVAVLGPDLFNVLIALSVFIVPTVSRIARASAQTLREQDFVVAAHALGASDARIIAQHILPNSASPLIVVTTLRVAGVILAEASLSFIGLGAQPPTPEWGAMISDGRFNLQEAPHLMVFPGIAILVTVLCLNFIGDALRDVLDPQMRGT